MSQQLTLPAVGTCVAITPEDVGRSSDGRTYMCRIRYDAHECEWVIASRLDQYTMQWMPVGKGGTRLGLLVFLNDPPGPKDRYIRVSAIKPTGKAVWADSVPNDGTEMEIQDGQ
jgi:hypothetical protein